MLLFAVAVTVAGVTAGSSTSAVSPKQLAIRFLAPTREPGIGGRVTLFALPTMLPSGTTIEAAAGSMPPLTVRRPAWLFWEDLGHGVLFPHPSVLLLLDVRNGAVLADRPMTSFPLVDGRPLSFVASATAYLGALDAIYDRHPLRRLALSAGAPRAAAVSTDFSADGLVTIGARDDPTFSYDFVKLDEYAKGLKLESEAAAPSDKGLTDAITKLADKKKTDIAIFLGGHGYAAPGAGRTYTDDHGQQIQEPESKTPKVLLKEDGHGAEQLTLGDLTRILGKFPKLTFKIIINSCHAGRWLEPVASLANVKVVLTATDSLNVSVVGFGAAIGNGLKAWAATPGAADLATGLRAAFNSEPVRTWAAELPKSLHPQISASKIAPTPPPTTPTPNNVTIPNNTLSFVGDICKGGTLHFSVTLLGIAPGTEVVIKLSGTGVPPSLTFQANPGQPFGKDFPIQGAGVWTDDIVSIGGKPPPSAGSHVSAPWAC